MKLLVFAHTPPPHHGQSYMVKSLLEVLGGDSRLDNDESHNRQTNAPIECYHINARLSEGISDIGRIRPLKLLLLARYCLRAIFCRFRYKISNFYYIPANPSRAALYRDWIVMIVCRPFFKRRVFHWHAVGLGEWLSSAVSPIERGISRRLLGRPDLSIVLAEFNRADAVALESKRIAVVPNGIPDPCSDFEPNLQQARQARLQHRRKARKTADLPVSEVVGDRSRLEIFQVLFIGLCLREKGLFDALDAVAIANQQLTDTPTRIHLTVAGEFWIPKEREAFEKRIQQPDLNRGQPLVKYVGFVGGKEKDQLFRTSDCLCFPTYYSAESFGLVLVEAMAYGLPIVTTNWRMIPEILPPGYSGIVEPRSPAKVAEALIRAMNEDASPLRERFIQKYTAEQFGRTIKAALLALNSQETSQTDWREG